MDKSTRPTWDEYFKSLTLLTATRSPCKRLHVGCILEIDNRIISQGYNGYLANCSHNQVMRDGHEVATIHAEQNAVADCSKRGVSCNGATAWISHYPCINCVKILIASGIKQIKYISDYRNDDLVEYFINEAGIILTKI
tara:strand:+ start:89 stop:505 length:417 start_codon:yes stop_codon:yes gene_type:complete